MVDESELLSVRFGLSYLRVKRVWSSPDCGGSCLQRVFICLCYGCLLLGEPYCLVPFHLRSLLNFTGL